MKFGLIFLVNSELFELSLTADLLQFDDTFVHLGSFAAQHETERSNLT